MCPARRGTEAHRALGHSLLDPPHRFPPIGHASVPEKYTDPFGNVWYVLPMRLHQMYHPKPHPSESLDTILVFRMESRSVTHHYPDKHKLQILAVVANSDLKQDGKVEELFYRAFYHPILNVSGMSRVCEVIRFTLTLLPEVETLQGFFNRTDRRDKSIVSLSCQEDEDE